LGKSRYLLNELSGKKVDNFEVLILAFWGQKGERKALKKHKISISF